MATARSKMQDFARQPEGQQKLKGGTALNANDFKVGVPGQQQVRSNSHGPNARIQRKSSNGQPGHRPATRSVSHQNLHGQGQQQEKHIYDTDASSLDNTTITSGTFQGGYINAGHGMPMQAPEFPIKTEHPDENNLQGSEDIAAHQYEHEAGHSRSHTPDHRHAQPVRVENSRPDGSGLPLIKGDSYPPTTSGNPSTADAREIRQRQQARNSQEAGGQTLGLRMRGGGTRMSLANALPGNRTAQQPQPVEPQITHAEHAPPSLFGQPHSLVHENSPGFAFAPAHRGPQNQSASAQPSITAPAAIHPPKTHPNQRTASPPVVGNREQDRREPQRKPTIQGVAPQNHTSYKPATESRLRQGASPSPPAQPALQRQAQQTRLRHSHPLSGEHSSEGEEDEEGDDDGDDDEEEEDEDGDELNGGLTMAHANSYYEEPPIQREIVLDYEPTQLSKMKYDDLRAESFDFEPNAQEFDFPEEHKDLPFTEKISIVLKMYPEHQGRFFQSLDIEHWEDVGDWFLERFGDFAKKFKESRQEKRKAAKEFEEEISQRHEAISKKRKITEAGLGDMKESGARVLQGTPKKAKKHV